MTRSRLLSALALLALLAVLTPFAWAAPSPPLVAVNRSTGQCTMLFGGDECTSCAVPADWEVLGTAGEVECPAGSAVIESPDAECTASRSDFCCSEGHSGSPGDCEDLVVNDRNKQCAFVDDVHACTLPKRWSARPEDASAYLWTCPAGYEWVSDVECRPASNGSGQGLTCFGIHLALPVGMAAWWLGRRGSRP
jgi:hypothetical protein